MKTLIYIFLIIFSNYMIKGQCWKEVSTGNHYTIAIKNDGTLWSWGFNGYNSLGDGTNINKILPIQIGTDNDWKTISAGDRTVLAIKNDGTLWGWGENSTGKIGDGTQVQKNIPIKIGTDTNWKSVKTSMYHTLALKNNGTIWSWGWNWTGQLGDNSNGIRNYPSQVGNDTDWSQIATGYNNSFALKNNGSLWGWGYNQQSEINNSTTNSVNSPFQIGTSNDWKFISANMSYHYMALKNDNTLWGWGNNYDGQLGINTVGTFQSIPLQIGNEAWYSITASGRSTSNSSSFGIKGDGTLWVTGENYYGQLGINNNSDQASFVQVGTNNNWVFAISNNHAGAINSDSELWLSGLNSYGELGNGNSTDSNVFVKLTCTTSLGTSEMSTKNNLHTYPNPTKGKIYFQNLKNISKVNIYDMSGKLVKTEKPMENYINISALPKGTYILKIKTEKEIISQKIIKQ